MNQIEVMKRARDNMQAWIAKLTPQVNGANESCFTIGMRQQISFDQMLSFKDSIEDLTSAIDAAQGQAVAYLYTLEYGKTVADTKVSTRQLNYPFGVCGPDYLAKNADGISYVRQTPLYLAPTPQPVAAPEVQQP